MPMCSDLGDWNATVRQVHWCLAEQTPVGKHAVPSLYFTHSEMSSQCSSWCISRDRP